MRLSTAALMVGIGCAQVEGILGGPFAGAFLGGFIQDQVDHCLPGLRVDLGEDIRGDLDQVGFQLTVVPIGKDIMQTLSLDKPKTAFQDVIGFGDQLHIAVFDAVMNHFDIMTGTTRTDMRHTGFPVDLGADGFEDGFHQFPGFLRSSRHDGRTP